MTKVETTIKSGWSKKEDEMCREFKTATLTRQEEILKHIERKLKYIYQYPQSLHEEIFSKVSMGLFDIDDKRRPFSFVWAICRNETVNYYRIKVDKVPLDMSMHDYSQPYEPEDWDRVINRAVGYKKQYLILIKEWYYSESNQSVYEYIMEKTGKTYGMVTANFRNFFNIPRGTHLCKTAKRF